MSLRRFGSVIACGFAAAVVAVPVQHMTSGSGVVLAQTTPPPNPPPKPAKTKTKQKKNDSTTTTTTTSPQPTYRVGPPDPGKY